MMSAGGALTEQDFTNDVNALVGHHFGPWMRAADDNVSCLDSVDYLAGRCQTRIGSRYQRGNYPHWLGIFDQPLLRDFFNSADASAPHTVAQDQLQLVAFVALRHLIAQVGLIHGLIAELRPDLQIIKSRRNCLAQVIYSVLIVSLNDCRSLTGSGNPFLPTFQSVL